MWTRATRWVLLGLLAAASCRTVYQSRALGSYRDFAPYVHIRNQDVFELELARAAHVAIVHILNPLPAFRDRTPLFQAYYPRFVHQRTRFEAGKHHVDANVPGDGPIVRHFNCLEGQTPSLAGCRVSALQLPDYLPNSVTYDPGHYLVVVSEQPIDPYSLAYELYMAALADDELAHALIERKASDAAEQLADAIADLPGSPFWAGLYVVRK